MTDKKAPPQDEISSQLHQLIILDCDELMEGIGRNIEAMARSGTDTVKTMADIRRQVHSLKGLGAVSYNAGIAIVAHRMEDYLSAHTALSTQEIDDIYAFMDCIRVLLARRNPPSESEFARIVRSLPTRRTNDFTVTDVAASMQDIEVLLVMPRSVQEKLIEDELRSCGLRVTNVGSSFEAIEMAVHARPDLIVGNALGDLIGGLELARVFRAIDATKDIPFILATSSSDSRLAKNLPPKTLIARKGENFPEDFSRCAIELGIFNG
jgi:CheY-like chemotaxis protein